MTFFDYLHEAGAVVVPVAFVTAFLASLGLSVGQDISSRVLDRIGFFRRPVVMPGQRWLIPNGPIVEIHSLHDKSSARIWVRFPDGELKELELDALRRHCRLLPAKEAVPELRDLKRS